MESAEATCSVCMECIADENRCIRSCGHMMCVPCDIQWRSRGKIEEVKLKNRGTGETCSVFLTVSSCPYCRRDSEPSDYMKRSKDSLFREIQFLTQTLFMHRIKNPIVNNPISFAELETIVNSVAPVVVTPIAAPRSVIRALVTPPPHARGTRGASSIACSRRSQGCTTVRTKLRCVNCMQLLCRACRNLCGCV